MLQPKNGWSVLNRLVTSSSEHNLSAKLVSSSSEHSSIHIILDGIRHSRNDFPKSFKFKAIWTKHPGVEELIRQACNSDVLRGSHMFELFEKLKLYKMHINAWNEQTLWSCWELT